MKQGIIIQGPTEYYKELADHYSQFDNVVWATWNDESIVRLEYIRSKGIEVVLIDKPQFPGYMNVNLQVKSTYEGIKYLELFYSMLLPWLFLDRICLKHFLIKNDQKESRIEWL